MAKTIPTAFTASLINEADAAVGRYVRAAQLEDWIEQQHYVYAHHGARIGGMHFDPAWTTTSLTYTQTNGSAGYDLDVWFGANRTLRLPTVSGAEKVYYELMIYGQNIDVQATVYNMVTGSSITNITASTSGGDVYEWASQANNVASTNYVSGGEGIVLGWKVEARKNDSTTARLFHFDLHEHVFTSGSQLPDGT